MAKMAENGQKKPINDRENSQKRPKIATNGLIKVVENGRKWQKMAKSYRKPKKKRIAEKEKLDPNPKMAEISKKPEISQNWRKIQIQESKNVIFI